jgi:hypothetical protein
VHAHNFHLIAHPFNISYILASFQNSKKYCGKRHGHGSMGPMSDNRQPTEPFQQESTLSAWRRQQVTVPGPIRKG